MSQMIHGPTFQHSIAKGRIDIDDGIILIPLRPGFRVKPDETVAALAHFIQSPFLGIESIVAGITQNKQNRVAAEVAEHVSVDLIKRAAKVAKAKQIEIGIVT